ncbi:MAG TPA: hypothetical protein VHG91_17500 [Longimicrobium sp.]|nr:hypothetical protein [Longimicrobium sp.]
MIPLVLWQMRWRVLVLLLVGWAFYLLEPGFHQHEAAAALPAELPAELAPEGVAFSLANLAGLSMLVLLWGFVSTDRGRGYYRIHFSHPTRPLAYYALRWALAYALSVAAAGAFLVAGQLAAWGELRVGAEVMPQALLFALVYGGLVAFFSVVLPVGDGLAALGVFALTEFWYLVTRELGAQPLTPALRSLVGFVLPPHLALNDVYAGVVAGALPWDAVAYAAGYGLFWLLLAGALLRFREWP